ncbi:MAG: two-component regulator propeller domain-containing protein, partial [Flavisolibacter sp.]
MNFFCRQRIKSYLVVLSFLLLTIASIGQEYSYTHYDSKDGLAGSTVYCVTQDREGFLWFGTENGLSRFDGTHFKNFTTADGLPDNEILRVFVDSRDRIWILPFRNSVCYYSKGKIYNQQNDSSLKKLVLTGNVRSVLEDKAGNILIQENFYSHLIKPDGRIIRMVIGDNGYGIADAGINRNGNFRIAFYDPNHMVFADFDDKSSHLFSRGNSSTIHNSVFLITPGVDVFSKDNYFYFFPADSGQFTFPIPENMINVARLNDSLITLNASSKTMIFNWKQRRIVHEFLPGYKVTSVLEDSEKNLWFTTLGEGIFRLGSTEFRNLRFADKESSLAVFSISKFNSKICIGTDHSLVWSFDPQENRLRKYSIDQGLEDSRITCFITNTQND